MDAKLINSIINSKENIYVIAYKLKLNKQQIEYWKKNYKQLVKEFRNEKEKIRAYWNDKPTGVWYSPKQRKTLPFFKDVEMQRYTCHYPYIPDIAEFKQSKGKKVLEVGCGIGVDLSQYAENGAIVYGIDLTKGSINEAKEYLEMRGLKANLQVMDAENLEFKDNTFDLVYSFGVLHHTPNTQKAIDEIHRVLKPKGKAIIMLYSKDWKHYFMRVFVTGILRGELFRMPMHELINKHSEAYGFSPLTKLYNRKEIQNLFSSFRIVEIKHFHYMTKSPNFISQKINSLKSIGYMQGNWIIKAIK